MQLTEIAVTKLAWVYQCDWWPMYPHMDRRHNKPLIMTNINPFKQSERVYLTFLINNKYVKTI